MTRIRFPSRKTAYQRKRRDALMQAHTCVTCLLPNHTGLQSCDYCRGEQRKAAKKRYDARNKEARCEI